MYYARISLAIFEAFLNFDFEDKNMLNLTQCVTAENSAAPDITTLHSKLPAEENFLRTLEMVRTVYFDWGKHSLHVFIGESDENTDENPKNWVAIEAGRFAEIAKVMAVTSADTVVVLASMKMVVIICNNKEYGPKTDDERINFLKTIRELVPEMKVTFWGHPG